MRIIQFLILSACFIFLFSCNSSVNKDKEEQVAAVEQLVNKRITDYGQTTDTTIRDIPVLDKKQQKTTAPVANADWDKKIIKTATLNFEVKEYDLFNAALREKVKSFGGYIAQEEQSQSDYKIENSVIIKVPVEQFDDAVVSLAANVEKVNEKKIRSQDVTTEFVDTKSRMEAKRHIRERYLDLLNQAKNMGEILNVQSEINGIQEQIEAAAGRIAFLGHSSVFSTIHLTYYQVLNVSARDKDRENPSFATKLSHAFRTGGSWVLDVLIGFVSVWPLFLLAFIGFIVYRKRRGEKIKI